MVITNGHKKSINMVITNGQDMRKIIAYVIDEEGDSIIGELRERVGVYEVVLREID